MAPSGLPETQKVVLIEENGSSVDVIKYTDFKTPQIESGNEIVVKNRYGGVNFIDSYFRKGIYPAQLPNIFGKEAVGTVAAVGDKVSKFSVGDHVAYLGSGTFAQYTKLTEDQVSILNLGNKVLDESLKLYAAALLQGLTALTFVNEAHNVKKDEFILVWAAAGGVGRLLVQLAHERGAKVIAIASTPEKLTIAKELGASYLINSSVDDIAEKVDEITGGKGVEAAFDSVGKDSFDITLKALARKGSFVSYGNSSGPVAPFPPTILSPKNLKFLRPQLFAYVTEKAEWDHYSKELFSLIDSGKVKIDIYKTYPLSDYKHATADLESRKTTGKLLLQINN